jgi:hypothetical protein
LQAAALSDVHNVVSYPLAPARNASLQSDGPCRDPSTVTLEPPVVAALVAVGPPLDNSPYENASVSDDTTPEADATTLCSAPRPALVLHATALDDTHDVPSLTLPPTNPPPLHSADPTFEPSRVTVKAPVAAPFVATTLLASAASNDTASESEPGCCPAVTATPSPASRPDATLQATALDDTHMVADTALAPKTPATL